MSLRKLPEAQVFARPRNYQWDAPSDVLAKWADLPLAADDDADTTISMFDVIGEDGWSGGGVTANRISAALRSIGNKDITVRINSPGGDMFEGIAIYNLLRAHPAKVTVEALGWAASAASIIAMAGDDIRMGLGSFMMVHNAWGVVIGNRHNMREAVRVMPLPAAAGDIAELMELHAEYVKAARAGRDQLAIHNLNDRFHTSLFALCRNRTLCDAIEFYTEVSNPIRSYGIADPQWLTRAIVEHEMMIDAAREGDRERLSTLVVEHMQPTRLRWQTLRSGNGKTDQ